MKARLKSVAVLVVISLVSAVLLTLASNFLPPAPMVVDAAMKQSIYDLSKSEDISAIDIDSIETEDVLFVFRVNAGANKNGYVVFATGSGYKGDKITMGVMIVDDTVKDVTIFDFPPSNNYVDSHYDEYEEAAKKVFAGLKASDIKASADGDSEKPASGMKRFLTSVKEFFLGSKSGDNKDVVDIKAINGNATGSPNGMLEGVFAALNFVSDNKATLESAATSAVDMTGVKTGTDVPKPVPSQALSGAMTTRLTALGYDVDGLEALELYYAGTLKASTVHGAYKITTGDNAGNIIIIGKANGYAQTIVMAVEFNATTSVAVNYINIDDELEGIEDHGSFTYEEYNTGLYSVNFNALWAGKSSSEVLRTDMHAEGAIDTIATLTSTPGAIAKAVQNALITFEYADNIALWFAEV